AAGATPVSGETFDAIWEDMMSAQTITAPPSVSSGPADRIDDSTHRIQPIQEMPRAGRLQSLVSAAILAIVLAGIIAAAWSLREGGIGGGSSDPGNDTQLAAPGVVGTPSASPTASSDDWQTWVAPQECNVEPMSQDEYARIMA